MVGAIKSPSTPAGDSSPKNPLASTRLSTPSPVSSNQTGLPSAIPEKSVSSIADEPLKLTGANWKAVYEQLQTAIRVRHYSNKTWQAYRYWLQQFQTYTKSKDACLLDTVPSRTIEEAKNPLDF
jgi:hypothetical protein